jgi:hypothetical protein
MKRKSYKMLSNIWLMTAIMVTVICLTTGVQANLGSFKQFQPASLRVLSNCSTVNIIEITNSNTTFIINSSMTKVGGQTFSYTFLNTSQLDDYSFSWNDPCIDCSTGGCGNSFSITATGQTLTGAKVTVYMLVFIISLLIFAALLIVGIFLPVKNKRDQMTGYIIALENLKYLKFFCIMFAYLVALFMAFFSYSVCYSYLDFPFLTSLTYFIFYGMVGGCVIFFPIMIYFLIANWTRDSKIADLLSRGLHAR